MGLEYMAQCVAAHAGLLRRASGEAPRVGFLLSVRRLEIRAPYFRRGQRLVASAHRIWGATEGLVSFDCELQDAESGDLLLRGSISCFTPREGEIPGASA
jgi:predicted hotdog family 3-hydroxylacyl-ACP dehydratase